MARQALKPASAPVLYTIAETGEILKLSTKQIRRLISANIIPAYKIGQQWRVAEKDLQAFLAVRRKGI